LTGPQLRALRLQTGLNQEQFGKKIGVHLNSMSNYERGQRPIKLYIEIAARCVVEHQHLARRR
jgi:transcriptional regulator with XRE-family HTH domain